MIKKISFRLNNRIFKVDIETENSILTDEDINQSHEELIKQISLNNETIHNIFFEELLLICNECGITLNEDEEKRNGRCSQCSALFCCECDNELTTKEQLKDNYTCELCERRQIENEK